MNKGIFVFLIFLVFFADNLFSDEQINKTVAKEIYQEIMSPFCPGRALIDCPTSKSSELKEEILNELQSGKSKKEVLEDIYLKYGNHLNLKPGMSGFSSLAWIIPVVILLLGAVIVYLKIKKTTLPLEQSSSD